MVDVSLWSTLVAPFSEYAFMRSALVACMALAVASGPLVRSSYHADRQAEHVLT